MFKIAIHNADHADVIANAFQFRNERAHAANEQIYRNARTGGRVQAVHQAFVHQIVELQRNAGRQAVLRIGNLFVDHIVQQAP